MRLLQILPPPLNHIYNWMANRFQYGKALKAHPTAYVGPGSKFEGMNSLQAGSYFRGDMGFGSYISFNSEINGKIGRYTSIGPRVRSIQGAHPFKEPYVSTSPIFYSLNVPNGGPLCTKDQFDEYRYADDKKHDVLIGSDVWIGADARIIAGTIISDGAIVLAGAIVTKNIPPYAIVGGVPAKIIGYRYDQNIVNKLLELRWWDHEFSWIKAHSQLFLNLSEFLKSFSSNPSSF